jgi:purine-binding chemotaxis protein CheW
MTRRDDKKPGSPTSQDALQDYLQQMLLDEAAGVPVQATNVEESVPLKNSQPPVDTAKPGNAASDVAPVPQQAAAASVAKETTVKGFDSGDGQAKSADLQQKLLQARVKDLAEKSVQAVKEKHAQQMQQESERRERMDAARALVKQRIAARMSIDPPARAIEQIDAGTPEVMSRTHEQPVQEQKPQPWLENGRPVWAQNAFECLLFSVSGLTLAVPLVELGSIYPIKDHLTPIIGQIDWFMGLLHVHNRNHIRTVNTAKVVMPEKYDPAFVDNIRYVISINGFDWGLAVDNVDKAIRLVPEDVRWRTERSKRPWLAGTVVDYMCALVDVQELAVMLSKADHSKPRLRH